MIFLGLIACHFSQEGDMLTIPERNRIRLWDTAKSHGVEATAADFSQDSRISRFRGISQGCGLGTSAFAFRPSSELVVMGTDDGNILRRDTASLEKHFGFQVDARSLTVWCCAGWRYPAQGKSPSLSASCIRGVHF